MFSLFLLVLASLGSFSFGSALGWSSPVLDNLIGKMEGKHESNLEYFIQWIVSLVPLGAAIGICGWTYCNNKYGPRKTMLIQSPFSLILWILLGLETSNSTLYMFARLFCGFFSVSYIISGESLLIETIHRANAPKIIIGHRSCILGGVLYSYIFQGYIKTILPGVWRIGITNPTIVVIHMIMLWLCPESPVYLYNKNEQKAIKSLIWYKGEKNIGEELRIIRKDAEMKNIDPEAHKYMFMAKVVRKALLIVFGLYFCQVFSGYYVFMFEYNRVWKNYNAYCISKHGDIIIYGIVILTTNTISSIVHYRGNYGIRKPLLLSCGIMNVANFVALIYVILYKQNIIVDTFLPHYVPLISTCFYALGYEVGLSQCPDILLADYIPHQVYILARMICKTVTWLLVFCYIHIFTLINQLEGGMAYNIAIMSVTSLLTLIFVYICVIETKNKTLIQIQIELGGNPIGSRGGSRQRSLGVDRRLLTASV